MKYKIHVSDRVLILDKEGDSMEWKEGTGEEDKEVESYNTLKECFDSMNDWGSRWIMYPSVYIETKEDGEVWESTAEEYPYSCCYAANRPISKCKNVQYENMTHSIGKNYQEFEKEVAAGL